MKKLSIALVMALFVATFFLPISASAADIYKSKGTGAEAFFSSIDPSGCIVTDVNVYARDEKFQNPPGPGVPSSWVYLYVFQYDFCNDVQLFYGEGFTYLADTDFVASNRLDRASLETTVSVYSYTTDSYVDVYVDLSWAGSGGISRQNSHFHSHVPGCNINSRFKGSFRSAEASGSISDGSTNFTPEPSWYANIFSVSSSDVFARCD